MTKEHVTSPLTYFIIYAILLVLVGATLGAAWIEAGQWNIVIAMAIAIVKTVLIVLFFMHLLHSIPLVKFVAFAGVIWLVIGAALTFADYMTRDWTTAVEEVVLPRAVDRTSPGGETERPAATHPMPAAGR